jgi:hypothetical protein
LGAACCKAANVDNKVAILAALGAAALTAVKTADVEVGPFLITVLFLGPNL